MAAGYAILALAPNKPVALIGVAVTCVGDLAQPAISSIMSKHVAHHEQVPSSGSSVASCPKMTCWLCVSC